VAPIPRASARIAGTEKRGARTKDHGYVFEVDPSAQEANVNKSPVPLKFLPADSLNTSMQSAGGS